MTVRGPVWGGDNMSDNVFEELSTNETPDVGGGG